MLMPLSLPTAHSLTGAGLPFGQPQVMTRAAQHQPPLDPAQQSIGVQPGDFDWIRDSDLQLLSDNLGEDGFPPLGNTNLYAEDTALPSLNDIESWWDSPEGNTFGGSSL